jgi:DegV family protein with EDD domain
MTDSSCDLPNELLERYDIEVLPLDLTLNGNKAELTSKDVVKLMDAGNDVKTSQVTPVKFEKAYEKALQEYDGVISVHLSAKLSGTYRSALLAAKKFKGKVEVVDSKSTSAALGALVLKASEIASSLNLKESADKIRNLSEKVETIFGIKVVDNLIKGGRAAPIVGKLMNLFNAKPILRGIDGEIKLHKVTLGFKRVLREIVNFVNANPVLSNRIVVAHVQAQEDVEYIKTHIGVDVISCEAGPVITVHGGYGLVLVGFIRDD